MASFGLVRKRRAGFSRGLAERRTRGLAVTAAVTTFAVLAAEIAHVWRRGDAPMPAETDDVVHAAEIAIGQTVQVARAGYRGGSRRENALLNLLLAFTATCVSARASTAAICARGNFGPFRNVVAGDDHIHHFVPGIAIAFLAGAVSIISRDERLDPFLALPLVSASH
jgi:hypothetical protein